MKRFLPLTLAIALGMGAVVVSSAYGDTTTTTLGGTTTSTTTTVPTTTTTQKPGPVAPLTGLPDPLGVTKHRAALTIKIDNTPEAMPQYGIEDADVVYEEIVEGGITPFSILNCPPKLVRFAQCARRTGRLSFPSVESSPFLVVPSTRCAAS